MMKRCKKTSLDTRGLLIDTEICLVSDHTSGYITTRDNSYYIVPVPCKDS